MSAFTKAIAKSRLNQQRKLRSQAGSGHGTKRVSKASAAQISDAEASRLVNVLKDNIVGKTKNLISKKHSFSPFAIPLS